MEQEETKTQFSRIAEHLSQVGRELCQRGWALGTSGNFSAVVNRNPLRLAITSTGIDKSNLRAEQIVQIDESGKVIEGSHRFSAEAKLHLMITNHLGANAVLHTHSVWGTLLSEREAAQGGLTLAGYEMLKGLRGVATHEYQEWLPIVANSQDMSALSKEVQAILEQYPYCHGVLLRGHGLYTWGRDLSEAKRHVEILEFLLEVRGRTIGIEAGSAATVPQASRLAIAKR